MNLNGMNSNSFPDQSSHAGNDGNDTYCKLTPPDVAAALIRASAERAAQEYRERGESPPPHVVSATRAGLEDTQSKTAYPPCAAALKPSARAKAVAQPICKVPAYVSYGTAPYAMLLLVLIISVSFFGLRGQRQEQAEHYQLQQQLDNVKEQNEKITKQLEELRSESKRAKDIARHWANEDRRLNTKIAQLNKDALARSVSQTVAGARHTAEAPDYAVNPKADFVISTSDGQTPATQHVVTRSQGPGFIVSTFDDKTPQGHHVPAAYTAEANEPVTLLQGLITYDGFDGTAVKGLKSVAMKERPCIGGCSVNLQGEVRLGRSHEQHVEGLACSYGKGVPRTSVRMR